MSHVFFISVFVFMLMNPFNLAFASCGCDKPPPIPAAILPHFAYSGMELNIFGDSFKKVGDVWDVIFTVNNKQYKVQGVVKSLKDITDPTNASFINTLVVFAPDTKQHMGPTRIEAVRKKESVVIDSNVFTMIGKPNTLSGENNTLHYKNYLTGVSHSGQLYVAFKGLGSICTGVEYTGWLEKYPLRFEQENVILWNPQGYLIDRIYPNTTHFTKSSGIKKNSDILTYARHSFEQWCFEHLPGGIKEIKSANPNWHEDETPHVDYDIMVVEVTGTLKNKPLTPGPVTLDINMHSKITDD